MEKTTEEIYAELGKMQKKAGISLIALIGGIVLGVLLFVITDGTPLGFIGFAVAAIAIIPCIRSSKQYAAYFKENVVAAILKEAFADLTFDPKSGISKQTVYSTGMMRTGDIFRSNDLIRGTYKDVGFTQSDVEIEDEHTDSDGHTSTETIFKGRWIILEFNKEFKSDVQIYSKYFYATKKKGGLFAKKEDKMDTIEMENEAFNKEFKVRAQSSTEAFYILTPHMMEALLRLRETLAAKIMLMFVGGTLHIAVDNRKDAFEPKTFGKLDPEADRARILGDIRVITGFVDEMSLDRDIYKS